MLFHFKPATVGGIIEFVKRTWDVAPDIEISMEANPTVPRRLALRQYFSAFLSSLHAAPTCPNMN